MATAIAIGIAMRAFVELDRDHTQQARLGSAIWPLGALSATALAALVQPTVAWPWLITWAALLAISLRQAIVDGMAWLAVAAPTVAAVALASYATRLGFLDTASLSPTTTLAASLVLLAACVATARMTRDDEAATSVARGAAIMGTLLLFAPLTAVRLAPSLQAAFLLLDAVIVSGALPQTGWRAMPFVTAVANGVALLSVIAGAELRGSQWIVSLGIALSNIAVYLGASRLTRVEVARSTCAMGGGILALLLLFTPAMASELPLVGDVLFVLACSVLMAIAALWSEARSPLLVHGAAPTGALALLLTCVAAIYGSPPPANLALAVLVCLAHPVVFLVSSRLAKSPLAREHHAHAAATSALVLLLVPVARGELSAIGQASYLFALVALAQIAAAWSRPAWIVGALCLAAGSLSACLWQMVSRQATATLYASVAPLLLLTLAWPFLLGSSQRENVWSWRAAGLAPLILFGPALQAHTDLFGPTARGLVPLGLGIPCAALLFMLRRQSPSDASIRVSAVTWLAGSALAMVTLAIPLQLDHEWWTIGWAMQAAALLWLWRRVDHAALKYLALVLFAAVMVRLCANPWLLEYHARGLPVINWLAYTFLVPTACLLAGWYWLAPLELARKRHWEGTFAWTQPPFASALASCALLLGFLWLNLTIIDAFSVGRTLTLMLERLPTRDLTMSFAWAFYGLGLLGLGVWRASGALRKVSLVLILGTCAKVFLYDLSHLADLYRVLSLVGLALSLMAVSFAYKRYVFTRAEA
jgi:hypothetical protein